MAHPQLSPLAPSPSASESTPLLSTRSSRVEGTSASPHATGARDASHENSYSGEANAAGGPRRREIGRVTVAFMIINQMVGTGIFATPSAILDLSGSVGLALTMWLVGAFIALAGMWTYVAWGRAIPRNGGEKNYLEYLFPKHRLLVSSAYAAKMILLGSASGNAVIFGEYILRTAYQDKPGRWTRRLVGFAAITSALIIHGTHLKWGIYVQNVLGAFKLVVLAVVIFSGAVAWSGHLLGPRPDNFTDIFKGSTASASSLSLSLYKVIFSFLGFANINYVLSEVKNPKETLRISGPVAVGSVAVLYFLANLAYLASSTKDEIVHSKELVAALLFRSVWGRGAERVLSAFVAFSALGNVMGTMFAYGRVIQEFGREGMLPFSHFFASNRPFNAPMAGIGLHWAACVVIIFALPPGDAYTFVINTCSYPLAVIYSIVAFGIIYLRIRPTPGWPQQGPLSITAAACFGVACAFLVLAPLMRPPAGKEPYVHLPYWAHVVAGWGVFVLGAAYWVTWARVLPWMGGYHMTKAEEVDTDGHVRRVVFKRVK